MSLWLTVSAICSGLVLHNEPPVKPYLSLSNCIKNSGQNLLSYALEVISWSTCGAPKINTSFFVRLMSVICHNAPNPTVCMEALWWMLISKKAAPGCQNEYKKYKCNIQCIVILEQWYSTYLSIHLVSVLFSPTGGKHTGKPLPYNNSI